MASETRKLPNMVALRAQHVMPPPNKTASRGYNQSSLCVEKRNLEAQNGFAIPCFRGLDCFSCFLKLKQSGFDFCGIIVGTILKESEK